jgi:hypothetical protein
MITFTIEDVGHDGHRASVRDQHGQLHIVRITGSQPEVGDSLFGQEALMGARVLVNQASHKPLQVRFEALGCTQGQALELLHPLSRVAAAGSDAWPVLQRA